MEKILNNFISCNGRIELKGVFHFDALKNIYTQAHLNEILNQSDWICYDKIEIEFLKEFKEGYYREFYRSGKLRRELPFITDDESNQYLAHGIEKIFYEGADSEGEETYTILHENEYHLGMSKGIWKVYSTDGGLLSETHYHYEASSNSFSSETIKWINFYPASGSVSLYEDKNYGKSYYENGKLKAEWTNIDFAKHGNYVEYYESGHKKMIVDYINGERNGLMYKYFEDSSLKEEWSYTFGNRNYVKKYYPNGILKSEWLYSDGIETSKKEFDKTGKQK